MKLSLASEIARTHLLARKRQTLVAMLGVTFGIAMFITMISFMQGVNGYLRDSALEASPHVRIYNDIDTQRPSILEELWPGAFTVIHHQKPKNELAKLKNGLAIDRRIAEEPGVVGTSPQVSTQAFYNNGPIQLAGIIAGVDIRKEDRLYNLKARLRSGTLEGLITSPNGILMGIALARKLGLQAGDKVTVTTPQGGMRVLRVVGTFGFGIGTIDNQKSYASLATVQSLLGKDPSYITDIHLKLADPLEAMERARRLQNQYGYRAEDWASANAMLLAGESIRNTMTFVVSFTLLVVAGFGIYNIMNMTVMNKIKDIAILKATGFGRADIVATFLLQAVFIGISGGLLGLGLGFCISYLLSITPFVQNDFISLKTYPVLFSAKYYLAGLAFGVLTTVLAGYMPARRASQVDPVSILRG